MRISDWSSDVCSSDLAYHLRRIGLEPDRNFVTFDRSPGPGGAWQSRWPSLTLATANRIHDLPGLKLEDVVDADAAGEVQASVAVPRYYEAYEATFDLRVHRPVEVTAVCDRGEWIERKSVELGKSVSVCVEFGG